MILPLAFIIASQPSLPALAVPVPSNPNGVGVNFETNRVYVSHGPSSLSIIDGDTSRIIITIQVGEGQSGVGVNTRTNRIYVANHHDDTVSVVNGNTNAVIRTIRVEDGPSGVGVNPRTNRVYVSNTNADSVSVIDGATNRVIAIIPIGDSPGAVAVNRDTDRIYVVNHGSQEVTVIDGATNSVIAAIPVPSPGDVGVNRITNRIYVSSGSTDIVVVIDGATNTIVGSVPVGDNPYGTRADPATNRVFVANSNDGSVSVIDGETDVVIATLPVGGGPGVMGVNPTTNRVYVGIFNSNPPTPNIFAIYEEDLLKNPSFDGDRNEDGLPDNWRRKNISIDDRLVPDPFEGKWSFRFVGSDLSKQLQQTIRRGGDAGTILNLEGFLKGEAVPSIGNLKINVRVWFRDGTFTTFVHRRLESGTFGWTQMRDSFPLTKDFERIAVSIIFQKASGTVWFDALHVWPTSP